MKLILIVDDFLPHSIKVAAKMMHEMALELKAQGHFVAVLTPAPGQRETLSIKEVDGVHTLFFKTGELKNIGKIKRAINETLLSRMAWVAAKRYFTDNRYDGIVCYSPSIFFGSLVGRLKQIWNCKSYLILRDIFPQWTVDNGLMKENSLIHRYFSYFERLNYRSADFIGVMSPSNLEFMKAKLPELAGMEVLFNWSTSIEKVISESKFRTKLGLQNKIVMFYGGNIGHAQNMMTLVNLAKKFTGHPHVHFLFVGKGDEVELLLREAENAKLENITYHEPVDQDTYFQMLSEFDIGLFSLHPGHKTHNFPGKLLGYMAYAKPILGCVNAGNDLKAVVNGAGAGFVVDATDSDGLFEAAKRLADSKELREGMGIKGKILLKKRFSVESAAKQIVKAFE